MAVVWDCPKDHLDPTFLADVEKLLTDSPYTWCVQSGFRSMTQQQALYAKHLAGGPLAAPPGKSAHNYGLAVDVVLDGSPKPGIQMLWDTSHAGWLWLKAACLKHPRLSSGSKFGDWPHIQAYNWRLKRYPK